MSDETFDWVVSVPSIGRAPGRVYLPIGKMMFSTFFLALPNALLTRFFTQLAAADYTLNMQRDRYFEVSASTALRQARNGVLSSRWVLGESAAQYSFYSVFAYLMRW